MTYISTSGKLFSIYINDEKKFQNEWKRMQDNGQSFQKQPNNGGA